MSIQPYIADTPEWHKLRAKHVGASEVAALFGMQPDYALSHYALWHVKAGKAPPPEVNGERVFWGHRLESLIAYVTAELEGWTIRKGEYASDDECPGLGASLDYEIAGSPELEAAGFIGDGVLECKAVDWLVHKKSWTDGEPPIHILLQLQHQLAARGYQWGCVGALVSGNDRRKYLYKARPKLIADIRQRVAAFWQSIRENKPPPVDGSDGAAAILRALYAKLVDEEADLSADNELPSICAGYLNASAERLAAEKREKGFKNQLIAKLGPHLRARCQGFRISTAVTPEKAPRAPLPGEMISGRAESRRYNVKEWVE